jgi:hypothetical protein
VLKLAGIVFLGVIACLLTTLLITFTLSPVMGSNDRNMWIVFFIILPVGFFFGSIVTGYFSYYNINTRWSLLWLTPGLYCIFWMFVISFEGAAGWLFLLVILCYYLASLAGVWLGYGIRRQIAHWWYDK